VVGHSKALCLIEANWRNILVGCDSRDERANAV
jgi:hypothetical protein